MTRILTAALLFLGTGSALPAQTLPNLYPFPNGSGLLATYNSGGPIDLNGPFFQSLGSNGRSCGSCHRPAQGWSISPVELKFRFDTTQGRDPIFRTNDGSNCDHDIDISSVPGRRKAYSLLTERGLFRIALAPPAGAEFDVVSVRNPYGCSETGMLSLYRRVLPSTNLRFMSAIMWDGRESSTQTGTQKIGYTSNPADLLFNLAHQALDATNGHAQATTPISAQQQQAIVNFEMGLTTAQVLDYLAGVLDDGASGGPSTIASQRVPEFFIGINDPLGGNPRGAAFTSVIFNLFDGWAKQSAGNNRHDRSDSVRMAIVRGQQIFNSKPISITGVAGLNDDLNLAAIPGTCGTCHNSPNIGNHSLPVPLNIGVSDVDGLLNTGYLPVITLQNRTTHEIKRTTDPGRALITGLWKDVGRFKGPILRALVSRPPYFHNGAAASLQDLLEFYDQRFHIGFTSQERSDLVAFLNAL
jgi:cytochrome c peroxidase